MLVILEISFLPQCYKLLVHKKQHARHLTVQQRLVRRCMSKYAIVHYPKTLFVQSIKFKTHYEMWDILGVQIHFNLKLGW